MAQERETEAERAASLVLAGMAALAAAPAGQPGTLEVGAIGADLPIWRAREALRNAELRVSVQAQAMQSLEQRATTLTGWSVTSLLVVGAAAFKTGLLAAWITALLLLCAALFGMVGIRNRLWSGAGMQPARLLEDQSASEFEATVGLAKAYQLAIDQNSESFHRLKRQLDWAITLMVGAPAMGAVILAERAHPIRVLWVLPVFTLLAWAWPGSAKWAEPGRSEHGS